MVNETFHQVKGSVIASGIASILLGILFLGHPLLTGVSFCYFIGGLLVIAGIAKVIFCVTSAEGPASSIVGGFSSCSAFFALIGLTLSPTL